MSKLGQLLESAGMNDTERNRRALRGAFAEIVQEDGPKPPESGGSKATKQFSEAYRESDPDVVNRALAKMKQRMKIRTKILGTKEYRDKLATNSSAEMTPRQKIELGFAGGPGPDRRKNYREGDQA